MNSALALGDLEQYSSARYPNESLALCRKNIEQDQRKQDFLRKCKADRKEFHFLSENELLILNDKIQNFNHLDMEKKAEKLPFDKPHELQNHPKEVAEVINHTFQTMKTMVIKQVTKKNAKTTIQHLIISPDSSGKLIWDFLCMLLIFYEILSIPFKISFDMEISPELGIFIDAAFCFDILLNFNTAIYRNGEIVHDHKLIAKTYLMLWFWIDLFSTFPYDYIVDTAVTSEVDESGEVQSNQTKQNLARSGQILRLLRFFRIIKIIRLLRLAKLKVIADKIEEYFQTYATLITIASFLKLSIFVLFWSHWLGCIFHFIAINEDPAENWMTIIGIYDQDWQVRYINSIYWAVTTMITVGYGDISPQTPIERFFGIFFLLVACGVFSFTMNTIGSAMQQMNMKRDQYNKRIADINMYMNKVKIPKSLQNHIRKYLQHMWDSNRSIQLHTISKNLSQTLRHQFVIQVVGNVLTYYPLLCETFQREFLIELTQLLQEQSLQRDENVFLEDESKNLGKLYFIQEGTVKLLFMKTGQLLAVKQKGEIFGEISFFGNQERTASAKSEGFSTVFWVGREEFIGLLKKFPRDLETFHQINDDLTKKEYQSLKIHCYACEMPGHVAKDCPALHFVVDTYIYMKTKNRCLSSIMKKFMRRGRGNYHAWMHLINTQSSAQNLQQKRDLFQFLNDESNIEDVATKSIELNHIPGGYVLKSKFKDDLLKNKKMQKALKKQSQELQKISQRQSILMSQTRSLEKILVSTPSMRLDRDEKTVSSIDEDTVQMRQKLEDLLKEYQNYKNEIDKHNGNQQLEVKQQYSIINDFDKGADFEIFNPHNNLSIVMRELKRYNFGVTIKPRIETEFEPNAFNEYIDYYAIDMKDIERFQLEVKPHQLRTFMPYTQLSIYNQTRQMRKQQTKRDSQALKMSQVVKRIQVLNQLGLK